MKGREKISRRTFLKAAAAGIGGMTLTMKGAAIAQEKPKPARKALGVEVIKIGG